MSDFDFVMLLEDLPNRNKQVLQDLLSTSTTKHRSQKEVTSEFLGQFNSDYKNGNIENLNFMTDYAFHKLSEDIFKEKVWPKAEGLEESLKLHDNVKLLYKELCNRHIFSRLQNTHTDVEVRCESWTNYLELFKVLIPEQGSDLHRLELPCKWIWEILDESIYQFQNFCIYASKLKKDDLAYKELLLRKDVPNFKELEGALKGLLSKSQILDASGNILIEAKPKTRHYVGYYVYLALIKLYVSFGFFPEAYALVQKCSLEYISNYLKRSWCSLVTFFYYSGLTYIVNNDFLKGTKILEKCCSFFFRYKHFLSKSMQIDKYSRLVDRATLLLTIFLSFNKIETEDTIMRAVTEKHHEKYIKLLKYDQSTFEETFGAGCCKIVKPLLNLSDLAGYAGQDLDLVPSMIQKLLLQLNKYRILNGVESILLIYSKLSIVKLAKILNLEAKDIENYLAEYESIRQASLKDSPFEQTFLKGSLANLKSHRFDIQGGQVTVHRGDEAKVDFARTVRDYISELAASERGLRQL
jgi:translation initiation factor 3 subunit L